MSGLKRQMGLFSTTTYIVGVIVGAGIYVIIGHAAAITGNSIWLAFLIAAFIAACTGFSYAELSSTFPYDSAEYIYTERSFHDRSFAFGISWIKLLTLIIGGSVVALGFGGYLARLTGLNMIFCAFLLLLVLAAVNLIGVSLAIWFDIIMIIISIIGLLLVILFGIPHFKSVDFYFSFPSGFSGLLTSAALIFFAFLGFENIGNISEEVKNPRKTLPLALALSIIISTILYILVAVVAVSVIPWNTLGQSESPLADVMNVLLGSKAGIILSVMALTATASTVLGIVIATSRMIYGMAKQGSIPEFFARVSKKRKIPYVSVIFTVICCMLFIIPGDIKSIAFLTDFGAFFVFIVVNLCLIVLRYSHDHIPRGFRVPLNIGKFPVLPALGLVLCAVLMFSLEKKIIVIGFLLFLAGLFLERMFRKKKALINTENKENQAPALKIAEKIPAKRKPKNAGKTKSRKKIFSGTRKRKTKKV